MLKVLVVDDEMPIRQWLEFCICKMDGVSFAGAASNGAEGYSMFRKSLPDVVITDIRMPIMDGLEMIQMMKNLNPAVYTIVLTSFEDFEYARKSVSLGASAYILKTEISDKSLRELLKKAELSLGKGEAGEDQKMEAMSDRNYFLRSLVLRDAPVPCRELAMEEHGIRLKDGTFYGICVFVENREEMVHRPKLEFLDNPMRFPLDEQTFLIVGNVNKIYRDSLSIRERCSEYCQAILEQASCIVAVSNPYEKRTGISEAMIEAYRRIGNRFYHPEVRVFTGGDVWNWKFREEEKYKIRFSRCLIAQDMKRALQIKNQMLEKVEEEQPLDVHSVKQLACHFMVSVLHMTSENIERAEEEVKLIRETVESCTNIRQLKQIMDQFFREKGLDSDDRKEYSQAVRKAIAFMEENYGTGIGLSDVAASVELSAEYLSRLFREETGFKFIVYLNNLRLKHAVELLENTNLKVYEVAERVGYSSLSYFSTVFKKNMGQNPFEYKNSCSGGRLS